MDDKPDQISEILEHRNSVVPTSQRRAAAYVRMSTEHQRYSIRHQMNAINAYAALHGMEIVRTYQDAGKSGLSLKGRHGLLELLSDVIDGTDQFNIVLVQDISRWGRFQDVDEAAYYEHVCKRAGYEIHYCTEQFVNNDSPVSAIMKSIKRAMASEFSRELSRKVFTSQCTLARQGYRQSGAAGYGLRRMVVDEEGNHKGLLQHGELKIAHGYRIILVKGPADEVRIVRRIYREFIKHKRGETTISNQLNKEGLLNDWGRPWIRESVVAILRNEKYIGNNVFNRTATKMKKRRVNNPPSEWIRKIGAFEPIIDQKTFDAAQEIFRARADRYNREDLLAQLRTLYRKHGYLSKQLVLEDKDTPSLSTFYDRFGSLIGAYPLVGFKTNHDFRYMQYKTLIQEIRKQTIIDVGVGFESIGADVRHDERTGLFWINSEFSIGLTVSPRRTTKFGDPYWIFSLKFIERPDIAVGVRLNLNNEEILDYYLLPAKQFKYNSVWLKQDNRMAVDAFRCLDLSSLFELAFVRHIEQIDSAGSPVQFKDPETEFRPVLPKMLPRRKHTKRAKWAFKRLNLRTQELQEVTRSALSAKTHASAISGAFATLLGDENFVTLLRAERIEKMPAALADKISQPGS